MSTRALPSADQSRSMHTLGHAEGYHICLFLFLDLLLFLFLFLFLCLFLFVFLFLFFNLSLSVSLSLSHMALHRPRLDSFAHNLPVSAFLFCHTALHRPRADNFTHTLSLSLSLPFSTWPGTCQGLATSHTHALSLSVTWPYTGQGLTTSETYTLSLSLSFAALHYTGQGLTTSHHITHTHALSLSFSLSLSLFLCHSRPATGHGGTNSDPSCPMLSSAFSPSGRTSWRRSRRPLLLLVSPGA